MASALQSILLLADRSHEAQVALHKASVLARYFSARIELFACDTEHGWAVEQRSRQPQADATLERCMAESRRYLNALRSSISAQDLRMTASVACAPSLAAGLAERLTSLHADLVVKNVSDGLAGDRRRSPAFDDWELVHRCAVPLLLTGRRPWRPVPQVWAAVDLDADQADLSERLLGIASDLAKGCGGQLHVHRSTDLASSLAPLLQEGRIDLLVLAGPEESAPTARTRKAADWVLTPLACDVLLVPRNDSASAFAADTADGDEREA